MSSIVTEFPDQTYTTSNKPSVETLKSDISAIETGHNDLETTAVKLTGTQSITGQKTFTSPTLESPVVKAWSGWQLYSAVTPTYTSADDPTYTITFAGVDVTSIMSVGMKVKFTNNSTTFYGIITAIAFSTNTVVTLYGGTDYDVANSAISNFYFSPVQSPLGFPKDPSKWTVTFTDSTDRTQATPSSGTWYNLGTATISLPIGAWDVYYKTIVGIAENGTAADFKVEATLSTANNSEVDTTMTSGGICVIWTGSHSAANNLTAQRTIVVAAKTSYYLNEKVNDANIDALNQYNANGDTVIRAISAYL